VLGPGDRISVSADGLGALPTQAGGPPARRAGGDSHPRALEVLILGGKPIREPVFQYGPFVMNSKMELIEALEDYDKGKFGAIPPGALMPHRV
jgi:hypothetical protein